MVETTLPINLAAVTVTSGLVRFLGLSNSALIQTNCIPDTAFILIDDGDETKQVQFQLSGLTTGTLRTIAWPDASGTVVLDTATQTLTNKELVNATGSFSLPTITGYTETAVVANTGTAYTIDITAGTVQILILTGNCTYTFPTATAGKSFLLIQKQDGTGGRTVTWPAAVKWPSNTAPTITSTASKADVFACTADGSNWIAHVVGQLYF